MIYYKFSFVNKYEKNNLFFGQEQRNKIASRKQKNYGGSRGGIYIKGKNKSRNSADKGKQYRDESVRTYAGSHVSCSCGRKSEKRSYNKNSHP